MSEIDELETPEIDVEQEEVEQQDPAAEDQTDPAAGKPEEPFLSVNERTVYKSKDDAIRGYNEAATRIAHLSAWEKEAKAYGLTDAKQFKAVAEELLALRQQLADAKKQATAGPKVDPADPKAKETEQVKKYLKELGYISKADQDEAMKELRDRLERFEQSGQRAEEMRFQNQEAEARNSLKGWLSSGGIKDDAQGSKEAIVGTLIKDWINNSDERVDRWSQGGVAANALVKEGYDHVVKMLGWKATPAAGGNGNQPLKPTDPGYAAAKARAVAANKKLPTAGTGKPGKPNATPKQKGAINAQLHEKAWAAFQEAEAANNGN